MSDNRVDRDETPDNAAKPGSAQAQSNSSDTAATRARLRQLPKIDTILARAEVRALDAPRWAVVQAIRAEVAALRQRILDNAPPLSHEVSLTALRQRIAALTQPTLVPTINATGVVLHTNLGRAPLGAEIMARVADVACGYSNLEYNLARGRRGSRHGHLAQLVHRLTGAEDAVVVNNNAGAVMLALAALAAEREVIVSRGELVEIGGSFRIPDVMRLSGARLVEVGTTNKTRLADYRAAMGEHTGLLLKVHQSNFAIVGFTEEVPPSQLAALGRDTGVPTMMDLGSGLFLEPDDLVTMGLPAEPSVRAILATGIDVVTFSGDKLLGGPQSGILCGSADMIDRIRRHPLMRALRPDKMSLAALEATLALYRDGRARDEVPAMVMLSASANHLRGRAEHALRQIQTRLKPRPAAAEPMPPAVGGAIDSGRIIVAVRQCTSTVGGGAMPTASLPSWGLALAPAPGADLSVTAIDNSLRQCRPPIVGRVADERLLLDLRTVPRHHTEALITAVVEVCSVS